MPDNDGLISDPGSDAGEGRYYGKAQILLRCFIPVYYGLLRFITEFITDITALPFSLEPKMPLTVFMEPGQPEPSRVGVGEKMVMTHIPKNVSKSAVFGADLMLGNILSIPTTVF